MNQLGPSIFVVFLYYSAGSMAIAANVGAQELNATTISGVSFQNAVPLGLLLGAVATYFNRTTEFAIAASNPKALRKKLDAWMMERGYELDSDFKAEGDFQSYRKSSWQRWTTGRIFVKWQGKSVTLVGRSSLTTRAVR